jgi:poly(A) polymerase
MISAGRIDLLPPMNGMPTRALFGALARFRIGARFVGGCVRNAALGRPIDDIDIAVDKPPEQIIKAMESVQIKTVPTGLKHGTVTVIVDRQPFEVTTLRRDVETDGRRAVVAFTDDWLVDAGRRDFTFNALYADLDGTLYDPFDGRVDLMAGRVRFIGDADKRIEEDRLRVLRFFRFYAWYGRQKIDAEGFAACKRAAGALRNLSGERVSKELLRLLQAAAPADAVDAMAEAGALDHWLPEFTGSKRLRALIDREDEPDALRRLAAILPVNANATAIGKRLKLSTQQSLRLEVMVAAEPEIDVAGGLKAWRAQIHRQGNNFFADRLLLAVDAKGDWRGALETVRTWASPPLPVRGEDALKLGLKPGPKVGALIEKIENWWIAGDFTAKRPEALAELERLVKE